MELQKPGAWGDTKEERGILVGIAHPSFGYQGWGIMEFRTGVKWGGLSKVLGKMNAAILCVHTPCQPCAWMSGRPSHQSFFTWKGGMA